MFCAHNPVDLRIGLTRRKGHDYIVIRCRVCKRHIGRPRSLFDLVEIARKRWQAEQSKKKSD